MSYALDRAPVRRGSYYTAAEGYAKLTPLTLEQYDMLLKGESVVVGGRTILPTDPINVELVVDMRGVGASIDQMLIDIALEPRHYGPGAHPGTGTEQEVHAGDDAGAAASGEGFERHGTTSDVLSDLRERARELNNDGNFAFVGRDLKTGEYLLFTDREAAVEHQGNNIRNATYEQFYAFTPLELMFQKSGDSSSVEFDVDDLSDLTTFGKDSEEGYNDRMIIIHNHPPFSDGTLMPPSPSDLRAAALMHARESRVYSGDGTYTVRSDRFGAKAANEIAAVSKAFDQAEYPARFPELSAMPLEEQDRYAMENSMGGEMKQYQLDRLEYITDKLPWITIEFRPLDE